MPIKLPDFLQKLKLNLPQKKSQNPNPQSESLSPNLLDTGNSSSKGLKTSLGVFTELYFSKTIIFFQLSILVMITVYLLLLGVNFLVTGLVNKEFSTLIQKATQTKTYAKTEQTLNDLTKILSFYDSNKKSSFKLEDKTSLILTKIPSDITLESLSLNNKSAFLFLSSSNPLPVAFLLDAYLTSPEVGEIVISSVTYDISAKKVISSLEVRFR